jgi:hypothetical protein
MIPVMPVVTASMVRHRHNTARSTRDQPHQNHQQYNSPLHFHPFHSDPTSPFIFQFITT